MKTATKKKLTMADERSIVAQIDWSQMCESCNANVLVSVNNRRAFHYMEALVGLKKEKGISATTDLLIIHCKEHGEEFPECKSKGCSISILARDIDKEKAIKESLND